MTFSKKFRRHLYRIWKVFKGVYGYRRSKEFYNLAIWGGGERVNYFKKEVEERGRVIKNVKDIADILAYLHRECDNEPEDPIEDEIRDYMRGNICRCTGIFK